jgi:RHS repeat-associated protein
MPEPSNLSLGVICAYDAWHRLVSLTSAGSDISSSEYDGLMRRTTKATYTGGRLIATSELFYSSIWQLLEERLTGIPAASRQFVWGLRHIDDLVRRDRDSTGSGRLSEELYSLQDANWNVSALVDAAGQVRERYEYDGYGIATILSPDFSYKGTSSYDWEIRFAGYVWETDSSLALLRFRWYHPSLGVFLSRDPTSSGADVNLYAYTNNPLNNVDPEGLQVLAPPRPPTAPGPIVPPVLPPILTVPLPPIAGVPVYGGVAATCLLYIDYLKCKIDLWGAEEIGKSLDERLRLKRLCEEATRRTPPVRRRPRRNEECDFYKAWCYWGVTRGHPGKWPTSFAQCDKCYTVCVATGSWPFEQCLTGGQGGPRWPGPKDPWRPVWPPD